MSATVARPASSKIGWRTIRKIGIAETLEQVELFHRIREYRLKAESKLVRVIDTLVYRKREVPLLGHFVKGEHGNNNTGQQLDYLLRVVLVRDIQPVP